jgi:single-stranded-DNA-specific exonuclease
LFFDQIDRISKIVKALVKNKKPKIVAHYDADGLCSASILIKALARENVQFELRIVKQLTVDEIDGLNVGEGDFLILADLGSGQLDSISHILDRTQVLVLDHHDPIRKEHPNLFHVNPLVFGEEEISGSMVCYLFAKALDIRNTDLIDLAIVGAIGDIMDEKWELKGLGRKILEEGELLGKILIERGIRMYGWNTRPVFKSLEYSFETEVPGVTGSESNCVQFLSELGIDLKDDGRWRRLRDLTPDETKKLATAIIMERLKCGYEDAEDVFGDNYTMVGNPEELQDARELATLLNACGRTGNYNVAVRLCLGDLSAVQESHDIMDQYKQMINSGMNWVRDGNMQEDGVIAIIDSGSKISDTVIGTVAGMALNSCMRGKRKLVLGLADAGAGKIKVSARIPRDLNLNLRDILFEAAREVGGEAGGHPFAAGAFIDLDKKGVFIKAIENKISKSA